MPSSPLDLDGYVKELQVRGFDSFSSADLVRYLTWTWRAILRKTRWDFTQNVASVTVDPGETIDLVTVLPAASNLIEDLQALMRVLDITSGSSKELEPIGETEFFRDWAHLDLTAAANQGTPKKFFYKWQNKVYILPPPETSRSLKVFYWKGITEVEGSFSNPNFDLEEALLLGTEARCHHRARQYEHADRCMRDFENIISEAYVQQEMDDQKTERVEAPWSRVM